MTTVRFLSRARAQLADIYNYIATDNEIAARAVVARVEFVADLLADNPELGHVVSPRGVRALVVQPYPYLIYYRIRRDVQILQVIHRARRQPQFHEAAAPFIR